MLDNVKIVGKLIKMDYKCKHDKKINDLMLQWCKDHNVKDAKTQNLESVYLMVAYYDSLIEMQKEKLI